VTAASAEEQLVRQAARAALDKKAMDVVVLDVQRISAIADYFLLCSGRSTTHIQTITDSIRQGLKAEGVRVRHAEGLPESGWVLLDYGGVLVHVFLADARAYYALERLWGDAPSLPLEE
jgi:ribosome-associated protein